MSGPGDQALEDAMRTAGNMATELRKREQIMKAAQQHAVELEQCSLFVDSPPLKRAMTDAAAFLREQFAAQ